MKTTPLLIIMIASSFTSLTTVASADAVADLQARYRMQGANTFSAAAGEAQWNRSSTDARTGEVRRCSTCHQSDLSQTGKHATTGKTIAALSPRANPERLTDTAKIEKWFTRNCKWTFGRECTAQEKGDFLAFIKSR